MGLSILSAQTPISTIASELKTSTVTITTFDAEGKYLSTGCGFFTSKQGDLVTCRHVVKGSSQVSVETGESRTYRVKGVIAEDKEGDLIRLTVDIPSGEVSVLSTIPKPAEEGEKIIVLGPETGSGEERQALEGAVTGVRDIHGFGTIIEISAPLTPGYSGSPVVNMEGEIIGVATFQVIGEERVNFAVPAERISRLIPREPKKVSTWESERSQAVSELKEDLYLTGVGLLWAEEWESALYCLKGVVSEDPLYVIAYPLIGYCSIRLGHWEEAVDAYRQTLLIDPEDAIAYSHLGVAYGKLDRWGEAVAAYKQAIRLDPDEVTHLCGLGISYSKVGEWKLAKEAFSKAVMLAPSSPEAHFGLGFCYWILAEDNKAWNEHEILKSMGSSLAADLHKYLIED